ncbi:hypothetical protein GCM10022198_17940 [Klugiella xanthotipulae]|uniref:Uncharacterized protein n=1 Tax=Klugiella xanthotipulae TaxID=244735 RepID=A0A543HXH3_9MICO|nr:hypothetical protein [Klugiella xanthotipulae]TQM63037.1 hypothetical protein FB466_1286 [Klugiella xanthotipulae]
MTTTSPWMSAENSRPSTGAIGPDPRPSSLRARVFYATLTVIGGFLYGTVGSIQHTNNVIVVGVTVPWGIIVALLGCLAIVVYARLSRHGVGRAVQFMGGVIPAVALYTTQSSGGTVLILGDSLGWVWVVGCLVIGIGAVLRPRVHRELGDKLGQENPAPRSMETP